MNAVNLLIYIVIIHFISHLDVVTVLILLVFRFSVLHGQDSSEWSLRITGVQPRDSGEYQCQVNTAADNLILDTDTHRLSGQSENLINQLI